MKRGDVQDTTKVYKKDKFAQKSAYLEEHPSASPISRNSFYPMAGSLTQPAADRKPSRQ